MSLKTKDFHQFGEILTVAARVFDNEDLSQFHFFLQDVKWSFSLGGSSNHRGTETTEERNFGHGAPSATHVSHGKAKTSGHRFCFAEHTDFTDIKRENAERSLKSSTGTLDEQK
jgi:hypothetical protein